MDSFGFVLIIVLILLILVSAFFSGSETSIMAINQIKLDNASEKGQKSAKRVNSLRKRVDEVLGVILIGNNLVNISASALLTYFVIKEFGDQYVWAGTLILTILIIVFAEIAPKNFAAKKPEAIAYPASVYSGLSVITFDVELRRGRNMLKTALTSQLYMMFCPTAGGDTE